MVAAGERAPARRAHAGDRYAGKYLLSRRIAVGGMGEIWVAKNEMTGADVALKVLRGDLDRRDETEARFRHEARVGATLTHRNIVRVFDLLEEPDGTLLLVMELLRGLTLRRALEVRAAPYSGPEAVAIVLPILSALQHAHESGIVHRDLKPANILLAVDPDGHVTPKLLDFGIAKVADSKVRTLFGRVLGTPRYMSPEQIRADAKIDGRSDVFSVAILLVEMLTGASPFRAQTPSASLAAVLEQEVDPDPRIEPRLWLALKRALAKRPYERYASAVEFATALRQAVGNTDAELVDVLQTCLPRDAQPSYPDLSGHDVTGGDDDDDDDDDDSDPGPESMKRVATGSTSRSLEVETPDAVAAGLSIGGAVPRKKWAAALGVAVVVLIASVGGFLATRDKPSAKTSAATPPSSAIAQPLPSSIPPPPEAAAVDPEPAVSGSASANAPPTSTRTTSKTIPRPVDRTTPPDKKEPRRRDIARKPDF